MRKKLLSLFMAFCMSATLAVPAGAAETPQSKEISIMDMVKEDNAYEIDIAVSDDGTVVSNDGEKESFNSHFDLSLADRLKIRDENDRQEYLSTHGYNVSETEEGLTVTNRFQTARLMVKDKRACDLYGAKFWSESNGIYFIEYQNEEAALRAFEKLSEDGFEVYPDEPMNTLDGYQYVVDQIGQYDKTVKLKVSGGTVSIYTASDLMGLTYAGRNVANSQTMTTLSEVAVAVIDSGIETSNPIFSGRVLPGYSAVGGTTTDTYGHGTHIASIILNNTPSNVKVVPVKITDVNGSFTTSTLAAGLAWCAANASTIDMINASISISTSNSAALDLPTSALDGYIDTLYNNGVLIVTSAGNTGSDGSRSADLSYPGINDKTICVSNITNNSSNGSLVGTWSLHNASKYGNAVDFCAPGDYVIGVEASGISMTKTDISKGISGQYISLENGTCMMSGTSQACAMLSSALANILSYDDTLSASEQFEQLKSCAIKSNLSESSSSKDILYGYGYPDMSAYAYNAGLTNSDGTKSGLVTDWNVQLDKTNNICYLRKYTGSSSTVTIPSTVQVSGKTYEVVIGSSNQSSGPFQNNKTVKTVTIPANVKVENNDASYMFYNCTNLTNVSSTPSNTNNASYVFYGCESLTGTITFPSDNVNIATKAFTGIKKSLALTCTSGSTTEKTLLAELTSTKNTIVKINGKGYEADQNSQDTQKPQIEDKKETVEKKEITDFEATFNDTAKTVLLTKYKGNSSSITIPSTYVYDNVAYKVIIAKSTASSGPFNNNNSLQNVAFAGNISIEDNDGRYMFYKCPNLKSVSNIPDGVTDISYICYLDSSMNLLPYVPSSVIKMDYAFYGCRNASGTQTIISDWVSSATGAYVDDTLTICCKADTTTYRTLSAELANYPNVKLNNGSGNTTVTVDENVAYKVTFHYRNKTANKSSGEKKKTVNVKYGKVVNEPSMKNISVPQYAFYGWIIKYDDGTWEKYNFTDPVTGDLDIYAKWSSVTIKQPTIVTAKKTGTKKIGLKYKKVSNTSGYQISYCHHSNFQNAGNVFVQDPDRLSYTVKLISNGTTYVKIRGFKKVNGKKYYGTWSKVKKVKM